MPQARCAHIICGLVLIIFSLRAEEPPTVACLPLPAAVAAWWRADTNIFDEIGGFDMELRGTLDFAPGKIGQSWLFNGVDTEVITDFSPRHALNPLEPGITFEAWIAPETGPDRQTFLSWLNFDSQDIIEFYLQSPSAPGGLWTIGVTGGTGTLSLLANITAGQFQHLAFTCVPATGAISFFLNGNLLADGTFLVPGGNYLAQMKFGGRNGSRFRGRLDEILLHSNILTADEILRAAAADQGYCWEPHPPLFLLQPTPRMTVGFGEQLLIAADLKGAAPLHFQWRYAGTNIPGAEMSYFLRTNSQLADAGEYDLVAQNNYGSITSKLARVFVIPLANGGFEAGSLKGWIAEDLAQPLIPMKIVNGGHNVPYPFVGTSPAEGSNSLLHGFGGPSTGVLRLMQDLAEIQQPFELSFLYRAWWSLDNSGATLPRTFDFKIEPRGGGNPLFAKRIVTIQPGTKYLETAWQKETLGLQPWIGQPIRIVFEWAVPAANTNLALFELDAVKLLDQSGPPLKIDLEPATGNIRLHFQGTAPRPQKLATYRRTRKKHRRRIRTPNHPPAIHPLLLQSQCSLSTCLLSIRILL